LDLLEVILLQREVA
jgi:hypothetical protein